MKKLVATFVMASVLSGCATPYQPAGYRGGYSEVCYSEEMCSVTFSGNGHISEYQAIAYSMLRSAELTLQKGFKYFVIVSEDRNFDQVAVSTANSNFGVVTASTNIISKPAPTQTILMLHEEPKDVKHFDAKKVYDFMVKEYDL